MWGTKEGGTKKKPPSDGVNPRKKAKLTLEAPPVHLQVKQRLKATLEVVSREFDAKNFMNLGDAAWHDEEAKTGLGVILNRRFYAAILTMLLSHIKLPGGPRAVVTSTPGVGKTVLGFLCIRELLRKHVVLHFFQETHNVPANWTLFLKLDSEVGRGILDKGVPRIFLGKEANPDYGAFAVDGALLGELVTR